MKIYLCGCDELTDQDLDPIQSLSLEKTYMNDLYVKVHGRITDEYKTDLVETICKLVKLASQLDPDSRLVKRLYHSSTVEGKSCKVLLTPGPLVEVFVVE